jgi:hypothetical protein
MTNLAVEIRLLDLTFRTIVSASIPQRNSFDFARAHDAGLPLSIKNSKMILEVSPAVLSIAESQERCAAPLDRFQENLRRERGTPLSRVASEPPSPDRRANAGSKENLVGINIPQTGDDALIDQEISDPAPGSPEQGVKVGTAISRIERLRS